MICVINLDACVVAGEDGVEVAVGERQARHEGQRVVLARQPVTRPVGVVTYIYVYMYIYKYICTSIHMYIAS